MNNISDLNNKVEYTKCLQSSSVLNPLSNTFSHKKSLCQEQSNIKNQNACISDNFNSGFHNSKNSSTSNFYDQSSKYFSNNSEVDLRQSYLFPSKNRKIYQHPLLENDKPNLIHNQVTRIDKGPSPSELQFISYRSEANLPQCNFNNRTLNNINFQDNICDHLFKKPFAIREESSLRSNLLEKFDQRFEAKQLSTNLKYNFTESSNKIHQTHLRNQHTSNISVAKSIFSTSSLSLQEIKEEVSKAISVIGLLHGEMDIPLLEMEIDNSIKNFINKLKTKVQKCILKHDNFISQNMTMENAKYIEQWFNSNIGQNEYKRNSFQNKPFTQTSEDILNPPLRQNFSNGRTEQLRQGILLQGQYEQKHKSKNSFHNYTDDETDGSIFSFLQQKNNRQIGNLAPQGDETSIYNQIFTSISSNINDEDEVDLCSFNDSSKAEIRDQELRLSEVSSSCVMNNTSNNPQAQYTTNYFINTTLPTKQDKTPQFPFGNILGNASATHISSRGRLIIPKRNFWEVEMETPKYSSTIARNVNMRGRQGKNVPDAMQEKKGSNIMKSGEIFHEPSSVKRTKQDLQQKQNTSVSKSKKTTGKRTKTIKLSEKETNKENISDVSVIVEEESEEEAENEEYQLGKKRTKNWDTPVAAKKQRRK